MNKAVNFGVLLEDLVQSLLVCNVYVIVCWSLSANKLDAIEDFFGGVVEIVDDDDLVACFK